MFSAKIQYNSGSENTLPIEESFYFPKRDDGAEEIVLYTPTQEFPLHVQHAKVFIMNENGKTISVYNLS